MCDSSQTSCSSIDTVRSRSAAERSDLARYMTGGPISDQRLVSCENGIVTFKARPGNKSKSKRQIEVKQSGVELVRNWTMHILPKGFTKSRCYGGYSSCNRTAFIALCQQLMPPATTLPSDELPAAETSAAESIGLDTTTLDADEARCPICAWVPLAKASANEVVVLGAAKSFQTARSPKVLI